MISSFFSKCFPHPFISVLVGLGWLMLAHSIHPASLLMAFILALVIPYLMRAFVERTPDIHWKLFIKLFLVVLWDIITSNIRMAKLVLGPTSKLEPKWFRVPLETQHDQVNTLLAMIITTTPGTVTAGIDLDRGDILVHALSTDDIEDEIKTIKDRYEKPLIQIFDVKVGETI